MVVIALKLECNVLEFLLLVGGLAESGKTIIRRPWALNIDSKLKR